MYQQLLQYIHQNITTGNIPEERKALLYPLINFVQQQLYKNSDININFICTHNSRRSHLAQVWAQTAAAFYSIHRVYCYSGGTAVTALHPAITATLSQQGFNIFSLSNDDNPVFAIKYDANAAPVIGFSKLYNNLFNPVSIFAAVMTCTQADNGCPLVAGAETRISLPYEDPKRADHSPQEAQVYAATSLQIATEMFYVFSKIKN